MSRFDFTRKIKDGYLTSIRGMLKPKNKGRKHCVFVTPDVIKKDDIIQNIYGSIFKIITVKEMWHTESKTFLGYETEVTRQK